jgi:type 1 glutamine amidotransferase
VGKVAGLLFGPSARDLDVVAGRALRLPGQPPPVQGRAAFRRFPANLTVQSTPRGAEDPAPPARLSPVSRRLEQDPTERRGRRRVISFATAAELQKTDVIVITGRRRILTDREADLEAFVKRGGGLVSLHDSLCGPDPEYFSTLVGGAKKHGEVNYTLDAEIPYTIADKSSPIMQGMTDFKIEDEAFFLMTWARSPAIHVLATAVMAATPSAGTHAGEVVPQIWTYEHTMPGGQPARAFVWMQGHNYANFANLQIQPMLLRGIAWAGKRPVGELADYKPPPARGRGGN